MRRMDRTRPRLLTSYIPSYPGIFRHCSVMMLSAMTCLSLIKVRNGQGRRRSYDPSAVRLILPPDTPDHKGRIMPDPKKKVVLMGMAKVYDQPKEPGGKM